MLFRSALAILMVTIVIGILNGMNVWDQLTRCGSLIFMPGLWEGSHWRSSGRPCDTSSPERLRPRSLSRADRDPEPLKP